MSYEDLLKNTVLLLKRHPEFKRPAWIIIDEIQDCDERQLEMIQELKGPETRIFAVGDPNQVIYSWRGSVFNIFYRLKALYQAKELSLPVNYRSSGTILKAAARFQETGMALEGTREQGEKITIRNHYDPFQEALYLADKIKGMHAKGVPYEEIAIFYRLQSQSETLKKVFEEEKVSWLGFPEGGWAGKYGKIGERRESDDASRIQRPGIFSCVYHRRQQRSHSAESEEGSGGGRGAPAFLCGPYPGKRVAGAVLLYFVGPPGLTWTGKISFLFS